MQVSEAILHRLLYGELVVLCLFDDALYVSTGQYGQY